jgi:hypothetical protein
MLMLLENPVDVGLRRLEHPQNAYLTKSFCLLAALSVDQERRATV